MGSLARGGSPATEKPRKVAKKWKRGKLKAITGGNWDGAGAGAGPRSIAHHEVVKMVPIQWLNTIRQWPKLGLAARVENSKNVGEKS